MNGTTEPSNDWSGFLAGVVTTWEWLERFFAALWSGLGWPHAVLIMFCIVIVYFKDEIKVVIPRIKKIGADGFEVESPLPPIQPSAKDSELQNIPKGDFPHTFGIVLDLVKKQIEDKDQAEALQFLVGDDAGWRVLSYFENIYSYIFGGQIQLLQLLNQRGTFGLSFVEAEREWEAYKDRFKPNLDELEMDTFLGFLITKELIIKTETAIIITLTGNEFLQWMTKFGRSTYRPW
ncbi:hypothetical protein [Pseudomonas sp. LB3P25]